MSNEQYRKLYAKFLHLFPTAYRERFGESMEQTFSDVLRERSIAQRSLAGSATWMFVETSVGIIQQQILFQAMKNFKLNLLVIFGAVAGLLMIPVVAMQFSDEWVWTLGDFVFAGVVLSTAGLTFELISRKGGTLVYRAAVALAVAAGLMLVWVNAAVGIIGEDQPANMLYLGLVAFAFFGALLSGFKPQTLSRLTFTVAVLQIVVPIIAYLIWPEVVTQDLYRVVGINLFFAAMWVGSGMLFQYAAASTPKNA